MTEPCHFCHPDPSRIFHEGHLVLGLWDAFPVAPGHALLVARRHVASWFDATGEERAELTAATEIARAAILQRHPADGFNLGVNIGAAAGQTVQHLHLHVIPRLAGDLPDPRGGVRYVIPDRANYLVPALGEALGRVAGLKPPQLLTTGGTDPLLPHLERDLARADRVDIAVAFVMRSGVELLHRQLSDFVGRGGRLRLVTGDYLDVTDPDALRRLHDLRVRHGPVVDLRIFVSGGTSFHPKAYLFRKSDDSGVAYVGSSNLSQSAIDDGVEWNYRVVDSRERAGFNAVKDAFETLFRSPFTQPIDEAWIEGYRARRRARALVPAVEVEAEAPLPPVLPNQLQSEALVALEATRAAGNSAGLVVLATGLGKTWLAAFDADRPEFRRVLFVAHREEILDQAMGTFRRIRPQATLGYYDGRSKAPEADAVFASIQTLGKKAHLEKFDRRAFDYVVVDEFHHASAATYRRLLEYFEPRFLLGLTATPERADGGNLLQLCQENCVFRRDLVEGIQARLLSPFHYFGVPDDVDYRNIPWRGTRFDEEELTTAVATQARARNALEQWKERAGSRTLAFCVSQRHADFMRRFFLDAGVAAAAVHAGDTSDPRATSLHRLKAGELRVLFAVDMFNEGVDLPSIDTVMMLRPTESPVVWLQQLGRGLRFQEGKTLKVIDYIGNHRTFLVKVRTLLRLPQGNDRELSAALERAEHGELELPPGCEVTYELKALDILRNLLRLPRADGALRAYYEDFRERQGVRPTASEAFHDGYAPRSARTGYGSWLRFVGELGGLGPEEQAIVDAGAGLVSQLETTPMTRSFKMLVILAMLDTDTLPGVGLGVVELAVEVRRLAQRSARLRADLGVALDDDSRLRALLVANPIEAWTGGRGTGGVPLFELRADVFRYLPEVPASQRAAFQALARELAEWRLAEYQAREEPTSAEDGGWTAKVSHAGGRPILFLPDRAKRPDLPGEGTRVLIDGEPFDADFVKVALNFVCKPGSDQNELPAILRRWFGADAGLPGTNHVVAFELRDGALVMQPAGSKVATLEPWRSYAREQIPALFGEVFSEAVWNAGFVSRKDNLFLLVTLEKEQLPAGFQYADRFLSPSSFQWESQNRTTQASKHGGLIGDHAARGVGVHLFVRRRKKTSGGSAMPFVYCGPVQFESWEGEKPITVRWRLGEPVPARLREDLEVPADGGTPAGPAR